MVSVGKNIKMLIVYCYVRHNEQAYADKSFSIENFTVE